MIAEPSVSVDTADLHQTLLRLAGQADPKALRVAVAVLREMQTSDELGPLTALSDMEKTRSIMAAHQAHLAGLPALSFDETMDAAEQSTAS